MIIFFSFTFHHTSETIKHVSLIKNARKQLFKMRSNFVFRKTVTNIMVLMLPNKPIINIIQISGLFGMSEDWFPCWISFLISELILGNLWAIVHYNMFCPHTLYLLHSSKELTVKTKNYCTWAYIIQTSNMIRKWEITFLKREVFALLQFYLNEKRMENLLLHL